MSQHPYNYTIGIELIYIFVYSLLQMMMLTV